MIGTAREDGGLYYFVGDKCMEEQTTIVESDSVSVSNNDIIMLWHRRLDTLIFVIQTQIPNLFVNKNQSSFNCEICQLAKHT